MRKILVVRNWRRGTRHDISDGAIKENQLEKERWALAPQARSITNGAAKGMVEPPAEQDGIQGLRHRLKRWAEEAQMRVDREVCHKLVAARAPAAHPIQAKLGPTGRRPRIGYGPLITLFL